MTTFPSAAIGADILEAVFQGRFSALGSNLQNTEALAVPLFSDASHTKAWRTSLPLEGHFRTPENCFVRAQNLVAIWIPGDGSSDATESRVFQALDPIAKTLRIVAADSVFYAFTYRPFHVILKLGKVPRGPLYGAELITDGIPVSGVMKGRTMVAKAIELSGVVRELEDGDEVVALLKEGWAWQSRWNTP